LIELYSLLRGYAANNKTATVNIRQFLSFISQYAAKKKIEQAEFARWADDAETEFKNQINALVASGKCLLLADSKDGNVFLPDFCREIISLAYENPDKQAGIPFLTASKMNLKIPEGYVKTVGLLSDMEPFFGKMESADSNQIISLQFPQNYGSTLLLASMIPRGLMESALIKIQYFLAHGHSMTHIVNTLNVQIKDKERGLKDYIDKIIFRPFECINEMERFDDFVYLFWVHFCALVKKRHECQE
jgi:hypothetical protein